MTYQSLGNFFASSSSGVSSHVGIANDPNEIGEYVARPNKAWCAGNANPYSIQAELCGFADWDRATWLDHPVILENCRLWIAEEAAHFGIPIVKSSSYGVCGHVDVSGPGGHYDPGPEFPWDIVLSTESSVPAQTQPPGDDMFIKSNDKKTYQLIYGGTATYWREVPAGMVGDIPAAQVIDDPNGSWKALWKVGSK